MNPDDIDLYYKLSGRLTIDRVKHWMKVAGLIEDSENPCYSRKIGVVIVNPITDTLVSVGHNGPPHGSPPCDDEIYLRDVVLPQLTEDEQVHAFNKMRNSERYHELKASGEFDSDSKCWFSNFYHNCRECPRRLVGAPSGKRLELCTCAHAEHNAIVNAGRDLSGFWMICHCGVPCVECSKTIVNSGISTVVCQGRPIDYSPYSSRWILNNAGVTVIIKPDSYFA